MKLRNIFVTGLLLIAPSHLIAEDFILKGGAFYGPGDNGVHVFPDGSLNNFVLTGPLSGFIPLFNNGAEEPNVLGEKLQTGAIVDGELSDGKLLNENMNNAFILRTTDPINGPVDVLVASIEGGPFNGDTIFSPDQFGNLTIQSYVAFDPGIPELVAFNPIFLTTGAATIPLSLKTQMGLSGGHDQAGPFPSGKTLIGRLGDFDNDGFLDGEILLAGNSPMNLVVAEGDPVFLNRPFVSDLKIDPLDATSLTIASVVSNFSGPLFESGLGEKNVDLTLEYLADINVRIDAAIANMQQVILGSERRNAEMKSIYAIRHFVKIRALLRKAAGAVDLSTDAVVDTSLRRGNIKIERTLRRAFQALEQVIEAIQLLE